MSKLIIISAFLLIALTSCEDNLSIDESAILQDQNQAVYPRDGRNPQTGETIKIPATKPKEED